MKNKIKLYSDFSKVIFLLIRFKHKQKIDITRIKGLISISYFNIDNYSEFILHSYNLFLALTMKVYISAAILLLSYNVESKPATYLIETEVSNFEY